MSLDKCMPRLHASVILYVVEMCSCYFLASGDVPRGMITMVLSRV